MWKPCATRLAATRLCSKASRRARLSKPLACCLRGPGFSSTKTDHLWSTGPDVDSVYLPLKCETFCVSPERGVIALLAEDLRVLDRASGRPLHIHPLPMANRLAAVLSAAEDRLAVLESGRLVVYAPGEFSTAPQEMLRFPSTHSGLLRVRRFQSQRKAVPLCFCDNGHSVALPWRTSR